MGLSENPQKQTARPAHQARTGPDVPADGLSR